MPEMTFQVRWPDGRETSHYSPSLVMHDFLQEGAAYPVGDFVARSTTALAQASERVRARYGFACTSAAASSAGIEDLASGYPDGQVTVLSLSPSLKEQTA